MKNSDFDGILKYKLIMPTIFILSTFLFFFGPFYCPRFAQVVYFVWSILIALKCLHMGLMSFYCVHQNNRVIKRAQQKSHSKITQQQPDIFHVIIIPNYNEPLEVLRATLTNLAKHQRSKKSYLIYLAMQKHEQNSQHKAQNLIVEFKSNFKKMDYSMLEIQSYEFKSKASNVNWCAEHLEENFRNWNILAQKCFLTIIDVDSQLLELYMDELEDHIKAHWNQRYNFVYGPFNIFAKNYENVPAMTRVDDLIVSSFQAPNIVNVTGFGFAISNYTVSYSLAKRIGFWDTNQDSITEDLHFMQKACWKTEGQSKTIPIFVPVNQMSIQTGKGYVSDIVAKFYQSERHCRCCNEVAYAIKMFFNQKFNWKTFKIVFIVFDTLALQVFFPLVIFSLIYQKMVLTLQQLDQLPVSYKTMDLLSIVILISTITFIVNFELITRRSNQKLFGGKNREWYKSLETIFYFFIVQYLVIFPTNVWAIFGSLKSNRKWFNAERGHVKSHQK